MKNSLITTIIPTYRRPILLKKAIQSVLSQTYPHFQLWVCDNASGDETSAVVKEWVNRDARVKYFCHEKNIGMMGNYQFGLSLVKTEFFSFLSDDDFLLPNFYETALAEFQKYPDAGFVAGSTIIRTPEEKIVRVPLAHWAREGKFDPPEGLLEMIGKYPVPTSILFRKKAIDSASIDHDNPQMWDCDYLLQIASKFPVVISKKPCAIFLHHPEGCSNHTNPAIYEEAFLNLVKNVRKNEHLSQAQILSAEKLILNDLALNRKHFFLNFLMQKRFDEAARMAKLMGRHTFFILAKVCKIMPFLIFGIELLRRLKRRVRAFKNAAVLTEETPS